MRAAPFVVMFAGWTAVAGPSPNQIAEIPFKWPGLGQIELQVSVQRQPPVAFILDTGAEYSVLSNELSERLGLKTTRAGARDFADGVSLAVGAVELTQQRVMIMPFDNFRKQGRAIEGLI